MMGVLPTGYAQVESWVPGRPARSGPWPGDAAQGLGDQERNALTAAASPSLILAATRSTQNISMANRPNLL